MEMKIHPMEIKTDANKAPKTPLSALFAPLQIVTKSGRFNILPNAVTPLPRPTGGRRKKTRPPCKILPRARLYRAGKPI